MQGGEAGAACPRVPGGARGGGASDSGAADGSGLSGPDSAPGAAGPVPAGGAACADRAVKLDALADCLRRAFG